jgi:hypothetical protein
MGITACATPNTDLQKGSLQQDNSPQEKKAARTSSAAFLLNLTKDGLASPQRSKTSNLAVGHFLSHVQKKFAISFICLAQQAAELIEKTGFLSDAPPGNVVGRLALGEIRQLRRFLTVIKELIEWALESAGQLFERFDGRDSVAILNAGNITTKQTCTLFDVALGEFFFFAECAKTVTNNHEGIIPCR